MSSGLGFGFVKSAPVTGGTPAPVNTVAPVVSGTPVVGQTLSVTNGTWDNEPDSYTYQWRRDGSPIGGATSSTYELVTADGGTDVDCVVTATNAGGSTPQASSNQLAIEGVPVNTVAPVVSITYGTQIPGSTFSCSTGTWTNNPDSYAYQWRSDAGNIGGATSSTYVVALAYEGTEIDCVVTPTNEAGAGTGAASNSFDIIPDGHSWHDASNAPSILATSGDVSQWNDLIGNANHLTQSSGAAKMKTGTRTINSKNVLDANGSSQFMNYASGFNTISSGPNTLFVVVEIDVATSVDRIVQGSNSFNSTRYMCAISTAGGGSLAVQNGTLSPSAFAGQFVTGTPYILGFTRAGTAITLLRNGVEAAGVAFGTDQTTDKAGVGNNLNGAGYFNGKIAEIIAFTRDLTTAEKNIVGNYLSAKWNITWTGL